MHYSGQNLQSCIGFEASIIQKTIQTSNLAIFSSMGLRIELLKSCPHTIPILAEWTYKEWHSYDASLTKGKLIDRLNNRLHDDKIPFTVVVFRGDVPVGTVSLKKQYAPEFLCLAADSSWLGSLEVVPGERGKGLGEELLKLAKKLAKNLGYKSIFLYMSNLSNLDWYYKREAVFVESQIFRNHNIVI